MRIYITQKGRPKIKGSVLFHAQKSIDNKNNIAKIKNHKVFIFFFEKFII